MCLSGHEYLFELRAPKIFTRAVKESGLNKGVTDSRQKVVFHTLRHTFASWIIQEGYPIALASEMLGHSTINLTMRYSHLASDQVRQAVQMISSHIKYVF